MSVLKAFATIVGTAAAFGIVGGFIGWILGVIAPTFYRQFFAPRRDEDLSPEPARD